MATKAGSGVGADPKAQKLNICVGVPPGPRVMASHGVWVLTTCAVNEPTPTATWAVARRRRGSSVGRPLVFDRDHQLPVFPTAKPDRAALRIGIERQQIGLAS